jgi:hypothetical protein
MADNAMLIGESFVSKASVAGDAAADGVVTEAKADELL